MCAPAAMDAAGAHTTNRIRPADRDSKWLRGNVDQNGTEVFRVHVEVLDAARRRGPLPREQPPLTRDRTLEPRPLVAVRLDRLRLHHHRVDPFELAEEPRCGLFVIGSGVRENGDVPVARRPRGPARPRSVQHHGLDAGNRAHGLGRCTPKALVGGGCHRNVPTNTGPRHRNVRSWAAHEATPARQGDDLAVGRQNRGSADSALHPPIKTPARQRRPMGYSSCPHSWIGKTVWRP